MSRIFRSGQPEATTPEDVVRQFAKMDVRMLLLDRPIGWLAGDRLHALHADAVAIVEKLDQKKGDAA